MQVDGAKKLRAKLEGAGKTLVPLLGGNLVDKVRLEQGAESFVLHRKAGELHHVML